MSIGPSSPRIRLERRRGNWHTCGMSRKLTACFLAASLLSATLVQSAPADAAPRARAKAKANAAKNKRKPAPKDLVRTPLVPADLGAFPASTKRLEIFLLMGQSNMKGRGVMPTEASRDPRIVMMHRRTDGFYLARHPLHLTGDPKDFSGADNAGVGPGLAFAQAISEARPESRILLIPCAVGGTAVAKWRKGQRLYEETIRRAKLALDKVPAGKARIVGALWLQGEADSGSPERVAAYAGALDRVIADLRKDLGLPDLPFVACTIGEMTDRNAAARKDINRLLLDLPNRVSRTACIDSRDFARSIGDGVHFDRETQDRHGRLYAGSFLKLVADD